MNKTLRRDCNNPITVTVGDLAAMIGCGLATAKKVGAEAGAIVRLGDRVFYNVNKIEKYINQISVGE